MELDEITHKNWIVNCPRISECECCLKIDLGKICWVDINMPTNLLGVSGVVAMKRG
jgi:hypothetical protein